MPSLPQLLAFFTRRRIIAVVAWTALILIFFNVYRLNAYQSVKNFLQPESTIAAPPRPKLEDSQFRWQNLPIHYPVTSLIPLPTGRPEPVPRIQHQATKEDAEAQAVRLKRLAAVEEAFRHAWSGYKERAWMADEVGPLSGAKHNFFGGWAATLVDTLDTLWIMGMKEEFVEAVHALSTIDFTTTEETILNTFDTTIRYMGGFLGAYDLSNGEWPLLLSKAMELGEMLLVAFDTPNRMPISRWDWSRARGGEMQEADENVLAAEIGSLTLELTRLSQITGDGRYFDAVQRIMDQFDQQQMDTKLPGMWPVVVNARNLDLRSDSGYTLGAMADSLYEYLPKVGHFFLNILLKGTNALAATHAPWWTYGAVS